VQRVVERAKVPRPDMSGQLPEVRECGRFIQEEVDETAMSLP